MDVEIDIKKCNKYILSLVGSYVTHANNPSCCNRCAHFPFNRLLSSSNLYLELIETRTTSFYTSASYTRPQTCGQGVQGKRVWHPGVSSADSPEASLRRGLLLYIDSQGCQSIRNSMVVSQIVQDLKKLSLRH
jgi:hypothetical protein